MKSSWFVCLIFSLPLIGQAAGLRPDSACYHLFLNYPQGEMHQRPVDETRVLEIERTSTSIDFNECQANGPCQSLLKLDARSGFDHLKNFAARVAIETDAHNSNAVFAQSGYGVIGSMLGFFGLSGAMVYNKKEDLQITRKEALNSLFWIGVGTAAGGFLGMTTSLVFPPDPETMARGIVSGVIAGEIPALKFVTDLQAQFQATGKVSRKLPSDYWALLHYLGSEPNPVWAPGQSAN